MVSGFPVTRCKSLFLLAEKGDRTDDKIRLDSTQLLIRLALFHPPIRTKRKITHVTRDGNWGTLRFLSEGDNTGNGRVSLENSDSLVVVGGTYRDRRRD